MANYYLCLGIFRIALPCLLIVCTVFRPCLLSAIYLLLLLISPWIPEPTLPSMAGITGIYLKLVIAVSVITTTAQVAFQIVLFSKPPYGHFLSNCTDIEQYLRYAGFVRLDGISFISAITWLTPEIIMLIGSLVVYSVMKKLTAEDRDDLGVFRVRKKEQVMEVFVTIGRYAILMSFCLAAVLRPSVPGAFYFLIFLSSTTWWSCQLPLQRAFAILVRVVLAVVAVHLFALYGYQFQWCQEQLEHNSTYARYFGLTQLMTVKCDDPRDFLWVENEWPSFVNPFALLWLYVVGVGVSKLLLRPQDVPTNEHPSEQTPLIKSSMSASKKYGPQQRGKSMIQDSTGSVIVSGDGQDDIPMEDVEKEEEEEEENSVLANILYIIGECIQVIIRTSYIATNIIMMAWSITFHSWITFVLLIWSNILWMMPNQRRAMLRCSPFLVVYSWFLLISGYVFSMNLTEEELPSKIGNVELGPIGFEKITELPFKFLLVKCLYTGMFWLTLRQYMREREEAKRSSAIADMVAPLQVTVGTAAGPPKREEKRNVILQMIGQYIKSFLTIFWIWIVAITLFAVAISGERMTGFRIIYMALFLFFILTFQTSFQLWRKFMFLFWIIVILYSMVTLILIYTYQFITIRDFWTLHLSIEIQEDIGLEYYGTKQLFLRLVTPTFFVIITAVQLHYFHKDFIEISSPKVGSITEPTEGSSAQGGIADRSSTKTDADSSIRFDIADIPYATSAQLHKTFLNFLVQVHHIINLSYLFMEIHMPKFVMLMGVLLVIYDKCALYLVITVLIVVSMVVGRTVYKLTICSCSVFVSAIILARMIYQIQYIHHDKWDLNCTDTNTTADPNNTDTFNTAEWLGFNKTSKLIPLSELLKWNIIFILAVTIWAVVNVRQYNYRLARGWSTKRPYIMFPSVKRIDADLDLEHFLKYICNYGFYKFGIEICLISMVTVIGIRMDVVSVIYAFVICVTYSLNRSTLCRTWIFLLGFLVIFIPLQYIMVVGLPPALCIVFPWEMSATLQRLQYWAFLINSRNQLPAKKIICDFILLLLIARQNMVFRIELKHANRQYPGGSNETIIHFAERKDFVNPVPDFITYCRSYLDVLKRTFLLSFMWITLAIVFLAGTNRVTAFSIGYLIGSFMLLWQGSDLYLKPIPRIIQAWDVLIGYNVLVIFIKTLIQLAGCVYVEIINKHACWLVQLFAIGCVQKFDITSTPILNDKCDLSRDYIGIVWDGLSFACMLLQRRIFNSFNFFHMINETKAATILASRGADLMEEIRQKRIKDTEERERKILYKIKEKMDRIKKTQQKLHGPTYTEPKTHHIDGIFPDSRPRYRKREPNSNKEAIRSGDYFMFDDLEDQVDLLEVEEKSEIERDDEVDRLTSRRPTLSEVSTSQGRTVAIVDPKDKQKEKEPQPSTSREDYDDDDDDMSDLEPQPQNVTQKILTYLLFVWLFVESAFMTLINFLNKYSRDYRYVLRVMDKEKKYLKLRTDYNYGLRLGKGKMWQPAGSYHSLLKDSTHRRQSETYDGSEEEGDEMSSVEQPTIIRLFLAVWHLILSQSEMLCYFIIFLHQIKTATFLSLPLPLMIFLWGTLSIPRPSKTFWVTIIAYTEISVLIKCLFQFQILPWNQKESLYPFYPPRIIGVEKRKDYALWDLLVLLIVFFHRYLLKCLGLWKSSFVPAIILHDGDYKISGDELRGVREESEGRPGMASRSAALHPIVARKASDLEKLVEETEGAHSIAKEDDEEPIDDDIEEVVTIQTENLHPCSNFASSLRMALVRYGDLFQIFMKQIFNPTSRVADDVYSYMFLCDFFNFFVILIGYSSFGPQQGDEGVKAYLEENRVPVLFLLMLILQFTLIIIDRAIFLRKYIVGKIIFQFLQIILLHIWLFILYPIITERGFNSAIAPQMYYIVKCFYLLLSAYQIRCGYPTRILGNFICKGYTYVNFGFFKAFMAVPFLFELRTIMDWMWTDTSMTIFDWIKMEDIFAHIFILKCTRHAEAEYPQPRGAKKKAIMKYIMGGGALLLIIAIIWFPLVFFSLGSAVGKSNVPYDLTVDLRIGPYQPIYQMSVQSNSIYSFNNSDWDSLSKAYDQNKVALTFISNYEATDITAIKFSTDSASIWSISPPDRVRMIEEIGSDKPLTIRLQYQVSHKSNTKEDSGIIREEVELIEPAKINGQPNPTRQKLLDMLSDEHQVPPIALKHLIPKFIKVTNKGTAKSVSQLLMRDKDQKDKILRDIVINRKQSEVKANETSREWWQMKEACNETELNLRKYLSKLPYYDKCESLIMYTFNDKIFPSQLNFIAAGGIIGVYTTIVLVAGRLLRGFFADGCFKIMFEDMPNVDRVLQLCYDVYLVREVGEFCLEEDLFAKLVFLFRSPETLIKWTRPKEEANDDEDDDDDEDDNEGGRGNGSGDHQRPHRD